MIQHRKSFMWGIPRGIQDVTSITVSWFTAPAITIPTGTAIIITPDPAPMDSAYVTVPTMAGVSVIPFTMDPSVSTTGMPGGRPAMVDGGDLRCIDRPTIGLPIIVRHIIDRHGLNTR